MRSRRRVLRPRRWAFAFVVALMATLPSIAAAEIVIESPANSFIGTGTLQLGMGGNYGDEIRCASVSMKGTVSSPPTKNATITEWAPSNCTVYRQFTNTTIGSGTVKITKFPEVTAVSLNKLLFSSFTAKATLNISGSTCNPEFNIYPSQPVYSNGSIANTIIGEPYDEFSDWTPFRPPVCPWNGSGYSRIYLNFSDPMFEVGEAKELPPTIGSQSASNVASTKATLNGMVNPNGFETTYQFEYGTTTGYGSKAPASAKSIGSGTSSVEVSEKLEGLTPETTYHFRLVATNAKGTSKGPDQTFTTPSWEILSTPNPSGSINSNLYDVSCEPSGSICTSVGKSTSSGADSPIAQRWNGVSWTAQSPNKKSGTLPTRLFGVDCPSETRCLAAGSYQPAEGGSALMTEIWNEGNWNVQSVPLPSGATSSELVAIGCSSTAQCSAVGSAMIGGVKTAVAARWTSPTWTLQTIPIPEGAKSSQLDGVDCLWSNFCVAVGRYTDSGGTVKNFVMFWNGVWSLQSVADPVGAAQSTLLDVSCTPSPNRCTAVGGWKNSAFEQFTLAYRFNGSSTWTLQSTPNPSGSIASVFQDVSCASETSCTAAGSWVSSGGGSNQTLAEKWNGTSWSIQGTPNPSGATFSAFFGVSCRSASCMGVGWSTDSSGVGTTLAEFR